MGRKLFNLKNIALVAVFSLVAFIGFNSFKAKIETKGKPTAVLQWYSITITDPSDPNNQANQEVSTSTISTPPLTDSFGCARTMNSGNTCAVQLSVPTTGYLIPAGTKLNALPSGVTFSGTSAKEPI